MNRKEDMGIRKEQILQIAQQSDCSIRKHLLWGLARRIKREHLKDTFKKAPRHPIKGN